LRVSEKVLIAAVWTESAGWRHADAEHGHNPSSKPKTSANVGASVIAALRNGAAAVQFVQWLVEDVGESTDSCDYGVLELWSFATGMGTNKSSQQNISL
jgi:hypothetical protein